VFGALGGSSLLLVGGSGVLGFAIVRALAGALLERLRVDRHPAPEVRVDRVRARSVFHAAEEVGGLQRRVLLFEIPGGEWAVLRPEGLHVDPEELGREELEIVSLGDRGAILDVTVRGARLPRRGLPPDVEARVAGPRWLLRGATGGPVGRVHEAEVPGPWRASGRPLEA
jgi:hypothetical protein